VPTCRKPVGEGANRVRTVSLMRRMLREFVWRRCFAVR
jgi:hypothetical protein